MVIVHLLCQDYCIAGEVAGTGVTVGFELTSVSRSSSSRITFSGVYESTPLFQWLNVSELNVSNATADDSDWSGMFRFIWNF